MILRRVIAHFRKQEWTAIFLDFIIVVVGVFVGLQVNNWNERRADHARAIGYLERVDGDLAADIAQYKQRIMFWSQVSAFGTAAAAYADKGETGGKTYWELLVAFFQASQIDNFNITRTTFDELTNAGDTGLIESVPLRALMSQYYANAFFQALSESPAYRETVRGAIPVDIQGYIWTNCYDSDSYNGQSLLDCAPPVSEERSAEIVNRLAGDEHLMSGLRYWLSTLQVAPLISKDRIELAHDLRTAIKAELNGAKQADLASQADAAKKAQQ